VFRFEGFLVVLVRAALRVRQLRVRHGIGGPLAPTGMQGQGKQTSKELPARSARISRSFTFFNSN